MGHAGHQRGGPGQQGRDREPVLGQTDRRGEHLVEGEPAEPLVEGQPPVDRTRHGGRADAALQRDAGQPLGPGLIRIGPRPRPPRRVEGGGRRTRCVMDEGPQVPTHAAQVGRGHAEDRVRADRGVDRGAAPAQQVDPGPGGQVVDGRHHRVGRRSGHDRWQHARSLPPSHPCRPTSVPGHHRRAAGANRRRPPGRVRGRRARRRTPRSRRR